MKSEQVYHIIATILYPVFSPFISKWLRIKHYGNFKTTFIQNADNIDYIKSLEERMRHTIEVRFTSTPDYTLAYIDFLDNKRLKESYEGPTLPLTLILSGQGSFSSPFFLNTNDPLVKAVSYFGDTARVSLAPYNLLHRHGISLLLI